MTLIPTKLYFNEKGGAKLELALAKGKKLHDKRETEKKRDWKREKGRLMRAARRNESSGFSSRFRHTVSRRGAFAEMALARWRTPP